MGRDDYGGAGREGCNLGGEGGYGCIVVARKGSRAGVGGWAEMTGRHDGWF